LKSNSSLRNKQQLWQHIFWKKWWNFSKLKAHIATDWQHYINGSAPYPCNPFQSLSHTYALGDTYRIKNNNWDMCAQYKMRRCSCARKKLYLN
jgi:hypothetical protein